MTPPPQEPQAFQTPLLDLLRGVPADARIVYEHSPTEHSFIPAGRLCAEAAARIAELEAALRNIDRLSVQAIRTASKDIGDWIDDVGYLGKHARGTLDAARKETPHAD